MMEWMILPLKRYAAFHGRARRQEFWMWVLFLVLMAVALSGVDHVLGLGGTGTVAYGRTARAGAVAGAGFSFGLLTGLFSLAVLLPNIAVQVRRLHDIDRRGWWLLLPAAPYVGGVVLTLAGVASASAGLALSGGVVAIVGIVCALVLLVWFCLDGTRGPNRFGEDPKRTGEALGDVFA